MQPLALDFAAIDVGTVFAALVLYVGGLVKGDDFGVAGTGGGQGDDHVIGFASAYAHDPM